jgi:nitrogen fixation protein FixH
MTESVESKPIDKWLPWLFFLFFGVVLAVNGVMVYVAAASWTGLETKQSYIKGRDYNRTLEEVERQKALGWVGHLSTQPQAGGAVRIELTLADARKAAVAGASVTARIVRPTHEGHDLEIRMDDFGGGRYVGTVVAPLPGQWDLRVAARHPSGDFHLTRRIVVP